MKQKRTKSNMYTFLLLSAALVTSCTQEVALDNDLPEGKYPMEFSATVSGLTLTRGTADNSKWAGTEKVAVMAGSDVKSYNAAADGALTSTDPLYWQIATETKTVSAWYPYSGSLPATFDVKKDQSGTGYQESDFLYAKPAQLSFGGDKKLTFKHLAAKVTVNLKKDKSLTESDDAITNATVTFLNQPLRSGNITPSNGAVAQQTAGGTEITPKGITPATGGFLKTVQALLVPQQMKNQQFIKVVAEGNTYYYTPTDANLAAGNQYTYQITVKKTGLAVTLSESSEWGNGGNVAVEGKVPDAGYSASDLKVGDYYYSDGMWSDGGYRKYDSGASTALLDIRPVLTDAAGNSRTVVGIVFWVKDITDEDPLLKIDKPGCTHGLVVALHDASAGSFWSTNSEDITSNWLSSQGNTYGITTLETENKMQGYANTKALAAYNAEKGGGSALRVLPVDLIGTYATTAPANSSGWYWPSFMELKYMCWGQNNGSGVAGKDMLNTQLGKVGGTSFQSRYYWSSTETYNNSAWNVHFNYGDVYYDFKHFNEYRVRAVLAF